MAHPSDAALRITLGRDLHENLNRRVAGLIKTPSERNAGYIEALHDVLRMLEGDQELNYAEMLRPPTPGAKVG